MKGTWGGELSASRHFRFQVGSWPEKGTANPKTPRVLPSQPAPATQEHCQGLRALRCFILTAFAATNCNINFLTFSRTRNKAFPTCMCGFSCINVGNSNRPFSVYLYLLDLFVCLSVLPACMCTVCMPGAHGSQKQALQSLAWRYVW